MLRTMKLAAGALIALAVVGAAIAIASADSTVGTAAAIALVGCAAVGGVALAFFAVGESEDRDRVDSGAPAEPGPQPQPKPKPKPEGATPPRDPHPPRTLGLGPDRRSRRPPRRPD
jgi:hypothetical protein